MTRAERRRQERRVKAMWLRRFLRFPLRMTAEWEAWAKKYAPRFAHHNKCDCGMCTGWDQRRRREAIKAARQEARRIERTQGED